MPLEAQSLGPTDKAPNHPQWGPRGSVQPSPCCVYCTSGELSVVLSDSALQAVGGATVRCPAVTSQQYVTTRHLFLLSMEADAYALLNAPDRHGWRGHTTPWVVRARTLIDVACEENRRDVVLLLAPSVESWRLLRPFVALHVPLRPQHGGFDVLWSDVRHVLATRCVEPVRMPAVDVWIGCLVFAIRRRPRLPLAYIHTLQPPSGTLDRALTDACWLPVPTDTEGPVRTRVVIVLTLADKSANPHVRDAASAYAATRQKWWATTDHWLHVAAALSNP